MDEFAIVDLRTPIPLSLAVDVVRAVGGVLEDAGYDAYFKLETGTRTIWARRRDG